MDIDGTTIMVAAGRQQQQRVEERVRNNDWKIYKVALEHGYPPGMIDALAQNSHVRDVDILLDFMTEEEQLAIVSVFQTNSKIQIVTIRSTISDDEAHADADASGKTTNPTGFPLFQSMVENSEHLASVTSIDVHGVTDVRSLALLGKLLRAKAVSYMKLQVALSQSCFVTARAFYGRSHNNNHLQESSADDHHTFKSVALTLQRSMHNCERDPRMQQQNNDFRSDDPPTTTSVAVEQMYGLCNTLLEQEVAAFAETALPTSCVLTLDYLSADAINALFRNVLTELPQLKYISFSLSRSHPCVMYSCIEAFLNMLATSNSIVQVEECCFRYFVTTTTSQTAEDHQVFRNKVAFYCQLNQRRAHLLVKDDAIPLALWPLLLQRINKSIDAKAPTISKSVLYHFIREKHDKVIIPRKKFERALSSSDGAIGAA